MNNKINLNKNLDILFDKALSFHQLNNLNDAEFLYNDILKKNPNHFNSLHLLAVLLHKKNELNKSKFYFEKAIKINKNYSPLHLNYGNLLFDLKMYNEALTHVKKSIFLDKNNYIAFNTIGIIYFTLKNFKDSRVNYDKSLKINPNYFEALNNRGNLLQEMDLYNDAIADFNKAILVNPFSSSVYNNLAIIYCKIGDYDKSFSMLEKSISINNNNFQTYLIYGDVFFSQKKYVESLNCYDKALSIECNNYSLYNSKGLALYELGKYEESIECFNKSIQLDDSYYIAYVNRGNVYSRIEKYNDALNDYLFSININENDSVSHYNCGISYEKLKIYNKSIEYYEKSILLDPNNFSALSNKGNILKLFGKDEEALFFYNKSLSINEFHFPSLSNRSIIYMEKGFFGLALADLNKSININPFNEKSYINRGVCHRSLKNFNLAIDDFTNAIKINKYSFDAYNNLMSTYNYFNFEFNDLLQIKNDINSNFCNFITENFNFLHLINCKNLKIGFVSGDFNRHSVSSFLIDFLKELKKYDNIEIYSFSNNYNNDDVTEIFKNIFNCFFDITNLNDFEASQLIYDNNINILIDLSGHTAFNRLKLFTLKPAPIQITWLGFCGSSFIKQIDYIIVDKYVLDKINKNYFSEKLLIMPDSYICYTFPFLDIPVSTLPALKNGYITFGSFNDFSKINRNVISIWSKILNNVLHSKLCLKSKHFNDPKIIKDTISIFQEFNIDPSRIILFGHLDKQKHFELYNTIDISLDPFPYNGVTTSLESLWMGVPFITKRGNNFVSNNGFSICMNSNLEFLIANDEHDYVDKAIELTKSFDELVYIRANLRQNLLKSNIANNCKFSSHFKDFMFEIWNNYCIF